MEKIFLHLPNSTRFAFIPRHFPELFIAHCYGVLQDAISLINSYMNSGCVGVTVPRILRPVNGRVILSAKCGCHTKILFLIVNCNSCLSE